MNVLLIHLNPQGATFQIGLSYIASILEAKKNKVNFLFLSKVDRNKIINEVSQTQAEIALISVTSDSFELCKDVAACLKKIAVPVLLGGIHPTISPEECIGIKSVLGVCVGEGEYAASEMVEAIERDSDYRNIQNMWIRDNGSIYKNNVRPYIQNLDELPQPNYEIFRRYFGEFKVLPVILTRGCPFDCSYCCNHTLRKIYDGKGRFIRTHGIAYSISLIRHLLSKFPTVNSIEFFDDTFTLNNEWLGGFLREFRKIGINFICNSRFDIINEELVKLLSISGCSKINAAVECGDEKIRKDVLRRTVSNEEIIEKAKLLKRYKISLFTHNMVGVPYENEKSISKTVELNRLIKPDAMQVSIFNPYPKSDLGNMCMENGWIDKNLKTTSFHDFTTLRTPFVKPHIVDYYLIAFESMVYGKGFRLKFKKLLFWFFSFHHNFIYLILRRCKNFVSRKGKLYGRVCKI